MEKMKNPTGSERTGFPAGFLALILAPTAGAQTQKNTVL